MFGSHPPLTQVFRSTPAFSIALLLGIFLMLFQVTDAQAEISDKERAGARATATLGIEAFQQGQWQQAIDYLERAEAIVHSPVHLAYIAQAQEELGRLIRAQESYLKVLRDPAGGTAAEHSREVAEKRLQTLRPRIPHLTIKLIPENVEDYRIYVDDEEVPQSLIGVPMPSDPGERRVVARKGDVEVTKMVTLEEGGTETVTLDLPADTSIVQANREPPRAHEPSSNTMRYAAYGSLGVGVVLVGVGAAFGIISNSKNKKGDALCERETGTKTCSGLPSNDPVAEQVQGFDRQVKTATVVSVIGFGAGAVGLGTGLTLFALSSKKNHTARAQTISPIVSANYLGVAGQF